jgi:DNA-directed RNA polymerase specialized sigma24 family protein
VLTPKPAALGEADVTDDESISRWIAGLRAGHDADIQRLWDNYFDRLVRLAGSKIPSHSRREMDEEDVALSALHSFCQRVSQGQFPRLADRNDLWRLLVTITARKAFASIRHQTRQKRGGGNVVGESAIMDSDKAAAIGMAQFLSEEPSPALAAQFTEDYERLLAALPSQSLKSIALKRLEGSSVEEIAEELEISNRTVERKLRLIRSTWEQEMAE